MTFGGTSQAARALAASRSGRVPSGGTGRLCRPSRPRRGRRFNIIEMSGKARDSLECDSPPMAYAVERFFELSLDMHVIASPMVFAST